MITREQGGEHDQSRRVHHFPEAGLGGDGDAAGAAPRDGFLGGSARHELRVVGELRLDLRMDG
jgi:hypothetical protein